METTPPLDRFDEAYRSRSAPWVIGEPQPAIVELERAGWIHRSIFGGSLAVYGRDEADPVLAAREAGCFSRVDSCCSTYCLMVDSGAPPQEAAK